MDDTYKRKNTIGKYQNRFLNKDKPQKEKVRFGWRYVDEEYYKYQKRG